MLSWVGLGVEVEVEEREAAEDVSDTEMPVEVEWLKAQLENPLNEAGEDDGEKEDIPIQIVDEL